MTNARYVRDELTAAVPNDAHALVIDLAGARYLDSAAIELLFELSRRLGRRRQELRLVVPDDSPLRRLLALTDVGSVAPVHEQPCRGPRRRVGFRAREPRRGATCRMTVQRGSATWPWWATGGAARPR